MLLTTQTPETAGRLTDDEVVRLAVRVLRDPRAWQAAGGLDPYGLTGRRVRARAVAILAEAQQTV